MKTLRTPKARAKFLNCLDPFEKEAFSRTWWLWAHGPQIPPAGNWRTWMMMGGRGAGKTRAGAEWLKSIVTKDNYTVGNSAGRVALIGETFQDARAVMIEGESGLLSIHRKDERPKWTASRRLLEWPDGTIGQVFSANDPEGLRGSQFGAAWCDELGCPAVDRGTNQPNLFVDSKSSESALPHFSRGSRDDLALLQYARAQLDYWSSTSIENLPDNPVSPVYQQPMIMPENMAFWAWDTRPYPAFPHLINTWSDGPNWYRGHWLNGRLGTCPLDDLVTTILKDFGLEMPVCHLDGHYQGFVINGETSARAALEPFLILNNISVSEVDGQLVFRGKAYLETAAIDSDDFVQEDGETRLALTRQSEIELPREVIVSHADIDVGFDTQSSSSKRLETVSDRQVKLEMPVVLNRENAIGLSNARLRDFWIGRDGARLKLPWKYLHLTQGDILELESGNFQVRTITDGLDREIEATAISLFEENAPPIAPLFARQNGPTGAAIPHVLVMNLPLAQEEMDPDPRVYFAATAHPWKSNLQVYTSPANTGFQPVATITDPATVFELESYLLPGPLGRWDHAGVLDIVLVSRGGEFESLDQELVFSGENALAIQTETGNSGGNWEVLQFQKAQLIGPGRWRLTKLLRGQLGTNFEMAAGIAAGAEGVLLNAALLPVPVSRNQVGTAFNWSVGAAGKIFSQSETVSGQTLCSAISLRPLSPCHLRMNNQENAHRFTWIRRSRMGGDNWDYTEIPLDFASEQYRIDVFDGANQLVRSDTVSSPQYSYSNADRSLDLGGPSAAYSFSVSQLGNTGNAGPSTGISVNA